MEKKCFSLPSIYKVYELFGKRFHLLIVVRQLRGITNNNSSELIKD